jgi:hypothetical protein
MTDDTAGMDPGLRRDDDGVTRLSSLVSRLSSLVSRHSYPGPRPGASNVLYRPATRHLSPVTRIITATAST